MRLETDCGWPRMSYCRVSYSLYKQYSVTVKYEERKCNDQMHVLNDNYRGNMESEWENILGRLRMAKSIKIIYM